MSDWEAGDSERQHNPLRANGLAMNSFRCFLKRLSKQQTLFIPSTPSHSGCLDTRNMPAGDGSFDSPRCSAMPGPDPQKVADTVSAWLERVQGQLGAGEGLAS